MGTTAQKLQAIQNSKAAIKSAIEAKGVSDVGDVLADYATKIGEISGGGSSGDLRYEVSEQGALTKKSFAVNWFNDLTSIPAYGLKYAYYGSNVTSISFPNLTTVERSGLSGAFYGCTSLTSVDLSKITSVQQLGLQESFRGCTSLTSVDLSGITTISQGDELNGAFFGCTSLTQIDLSNLTTIGNYGIREAFRSCTSLSQIDLSKVTTIGYQGIRQAFDGCTSLRTVLLKKLSSANSAFQQTFQNCTHLELVDFSEATAVPALNNTNAFTNTNNYYRIVVPNALYDQWITATNWSNSSIVTHIEKAIKGLVFKAGSANSTISLDAVGTPTSIDIEYSTDGGTTFSPYTVGTTITLTSVDDTVMFRAGSTGQTALADDSSNYHKFVMTGSISVDDSLVWLFNRQGTEPQTLDDYAFYGLFNGCSALQNAPELPFTSLGDYSYAYMFAGCTGLTTPPALPATTLGDYCYSNMFNGCTGLTTAPTLANTSLTEGCYEGMFKGCTSITEAPTLPATTLATGCYNEMFYGCSALNNIKLSYTGNFSTTYFNDWVYGVAASGTFYYQGSDTTVGTSAIPSGWTIPTYEYGGLTFTSRQNNSTVKMVADSGAPSVSLQYTKTGVSWTNYTLGDTITVNAGENLGFKATTTNGAFSTTYNLKSNYFVTTGQFDLSGNINSLLNENYESVTSIPNSCWGYLFKNNTSIIDASNLKFPATTVDNFGYGWMFSGCSNMTKGPEIFATSIGSQYGIDHFFYNCSSLTEIKIHYTGSFGGNRFSSWVDGVQTTGGTFYYNGSDTTTGVSAIPVNWTVTPFVPPVEYKNYINTNIAEMNTGVIPTTDTKVVGRFRGSAVGNWFVGSSDAKWRGFNSQNTFYLDLNGMSARINKSGWDTTKWYDVEYGNFYFNCVPVDGGTTISQSSTARSFTHTTPLMLGSATYSWGGEYEKFDCAGFKIYEGNTLVKDYRPALDGNGVACFYEEVSGTYAYPSSGTFLAY